MSKPNKHKNDYSLYIGFIIRDLFTKEEFRIRGFDNESFIAIPVNLKSFTEKDEVKIPFKDFSVKYTFGNDF